MSDLKPCPFCGKAVLDDPAIWEQGNDSAIQCGYCGAVGPWRDSLEPESERDDLWNRRAPNREALIAVAKLAWEAGIDAAGSASDADAERIVAEYLAEQE